MFSFKNLYIYCYRLRFIFKKIIFSFRKNEFFIFEKIIEISSKRKISLKDFLYLSKVEVPEKFFDTKLLSIFFLKKKRIKKKIFLFKIHNNYEYDILYFYYKLFILMGWLCESYKIRKHLINYKYKENKYIIESINKKKLINFNNFIKKKQLIKNYDKSLINLIKNKNIAIVGPADNKNKNGEEIDNFDTVVRINNLNEENLNLKKGYKTDIIFLNGVKSDQVIIENKLSFIKKIKILFVKNNSYSHLFKKIGLSNIKLITNIDNFFALGIANMLPFILFEILRYNPKKIKVFDNDLMLNPKRMKNYQSRSSYDIKNFLRMLTHHDPVSQLNFIKFLCNKNKIITGDKNFLSAIKNNEINYLKKLEKNYNL